MKTAAIILQCQMRCYLSYREQERRVKRAAERKKVGQNVAYGNRLSTTQFVLFVRRTRTAMKI